MSERDQGGGGRMGADDVVRHRALVPGKHAGTDEGGPMPNVPGKRSGTEHLEPAHGLPMPVQTAVERETGTPLPNADRWSERVGADVNHAHVVTGGGAEAATASLGVKGFTVGNRVFLGAGVSPTDDQVMSHELTHTVQQKDASVPAAKDLTVTAHEQDVEKQARDTEAGPQAAIAPATEAQIAPIGFMGKMGPGGGTGNPFTPPSPQITSFKYFEKHGKDHFKQLADQKLGGFTADTGSPYAKWTSGDSSAFGGTMAYVLSVRSGGKPYDVLEKTIAPDSGHALIEKGRDAENKDDPAQANELNLGVTLEMGKAYALRVREALKRLMPRLIKEWNRRTLEDFEKRTKGSTPESKKHYKESPENNLPGVAILQSHPIDDFVLHALSFMGSTPITPDFAAYRKAFPEEAKPGNAPAELRKVKFAWQAPNRARHWIKVTDPIDATPEEVAKELFGDTLLTYLVTPASPLFGLDNRKHNLAQPYESQYGKITDDKSPGNSNEEEILQGPQGDDAALNSAAGLKTEKASTAAVAQQLDMVVHQLKQASAMAASWITFDKGIDQAVKRAEDRKPKVAKDQAEADKWNAQIRKQLEIAQNCHKSLDVLTKSNTVYKDDGAARGVLHDVGKLYVKVAANSDLVGVAATQLDEANHHFLAHPAEVIEVKFKWMHRALLASRKNAKTGKDDPMAVHLAQKEQKLRLDLMKVRDLLLSNPTAAKPELDRIEKELQDLALGVAAVHNIDACNEAWVEVKEGKSPAGWIRSLFSNPVTGNHGNDRLDALAAQADRFQLDWQKILEKWRTGDHDGASADLKTLTDKPEWKKFFTDVAKEIKDQATYDRWMVFALLVGIAIATGFIGAAIEPIAVGLAGPVLGGIVLTAATEATVFTTLSYFLVEKHPNMEGFKSELGKNMLVFGALKVVSKGFQAAEKLFGTKLTATEVVTVFAGLNGHALYEENKKKKNGETLSEAEIMKISFDNLLFTIATMVGSKLFAPMVARWKLRGEIGKQLDKFDTVHKEVVSLGEQVKTTKDKAAAQKLLEKQAELIKLERQILETLNDIVSKGFEVARKLGMTKEQFEHAQEASGAMAEAAKSLRTAEIMMKLEHVGGNQHLVEPGKTFEEVRDHFASDKENKVSGITRDGEGGPRSFEVEIDGNKIRISERAGKPGEVNTKTTNTNPSSGGEPPPPRAEEVAAAHGITEPTALKTFNELYIAQPKQLLDFLNALKSRPGLANKLLAEFGKGALSHFEAKGEGVTIHGEIDISAGALDGLSAADRAKLVELCKNKGPETDFVYFETSSTASGPGTRFRFKTRTSSVAKRVLAELLSSLGLTTGDPKAKFLGKEITSPGEQARLWDLKNEGVYKDATMRKAAAEWALARSSNVNDLVARMQFFEVEVARAAEVKAAKVKAEFDTRVADHKAANAGKIDGKTETKIARDVTSSMLGESLQSASGPAAKKAAARRVMDEFAHAETAPDGSASTKGMNTADAAWKVNTDPLTGPNATGAKSVGELPDTALAGHVKSIADTLNFTNDAEAAYHAHKHAGDLPAKPTAADEMATVLKAARDVVKSTDPAFTIEQNGTRKLTFVSNGLRTIVKISPEGNAYIATFGKAN